jgi:hypothetical protein
VRNNVVWSEIALLEEALQSEIAALFGQWRSGEFI